MPGIALLAAFALTASAAAAPAPLRGADRVAHVYDLILDARFDAAAAALPSACGPAPDAAPPEACEVLQATATWWHILLDPEDTREDAAFTAQVERAIRDTEAWAARDPLSAEAQFYTGAAYAVRVQWRVLRDQKVAAARDGKRIKQALERAIVLDPSLEDAHFGIGLYEYYADVAPAAAKFLRFLLLLPGGDRTRGLAEMLRARDRGRLLQGEADYQLQIIYLWYEHRVDKAVALLEGLRERYPGNPLFLAQLAGVRDTYQHDLTASLADWQALLAGAEGGRINEPALAEAEARLAIAREEDALYETDRALDQLRTLLQDHPAHPFGIEADAYLALGAGEDRLGHRDAALAAYRLAAAAAPAGDPHDVQHQAADRIKRAPDATRAEAYRTSLEGWRRFEAGDLADAEGLLARSVTLNPKAPVARYRYARVLLARRQTAGAVAQFTIALAMAKDMPGAIAASAWLYAGRAHEQLDRLDDARACYRTAESWFGGSAATRRAAARALARLTPHRR